MNLVYSLVLLLSATAATVAQAPGRDAIYTPYGKQETQGYQFSGALYFGNQFFGSGVLVAPNVVLTAGHCLDGITPDKVRFNGRDYRVIRAQKHPDYKRGRFKDGADVGLIWLLSPPKVKPAEINFDPVPDGTELIIAAYGSDGVKRVTLPKTAFSWQTSEDVVTWAATETWASPGDSGGPVLTLNPETLCFEVRAVVMFVSWDNYGPLRSGATLLRPYKPWIRVQLADPEPVRFRFQELPVVGVDAGSKAA